MMKTQMKPDTFEQLKSILGDVHPDRNFLAEYVEALEHLRSEDEIFTCFAFRHASAGGSYSGYDIHIQSCDSELYQPLKTDQKMEIRGWWHDIVRREAEEFPDLKT